MAENVADHPDDIAIERSLIRWRSLGAEAGRSMRLAVVVSALAGLIWVTAAKAADVGHVRSSDVLPGRLSAAMLAGLLFQVACVTMQVSAGRYVQARSTRVDVRRKNGPLRLFGWALTAAPIAVACLVYWQAGMGLHRSGLTSRLQAPSGHAPMTAIRLLVVITWAAALVTVLLWWLTRSLVRRNLDSARSRGAHRDPETIPYDGSRVQPVGGGTLPAERLHRDRRYARDTSKWSAGGDRHDEPTEDIAAGRLPLVLSFSGGGLRSASFCLGGFRAVQTDPDRQQAVDAIVSVSGGSYAASALSMAASFDADGGRHQDDPIPVSDVYSLDSPELAYLRRNSRYLFQPSWRTMSGLWQLAAGAVLHILLVVAALRFASWLLGWFVQTVGLVPRLTTSDPGLDLTPHWAFPSLLGTAPWLLALIALGGLLILQSLLRGERAEGGTATSPSAPWWARSVAGSGKVLAASLFALVLVPALFVGLGRVAYDGTGPDVVGRAIVNLGFTQDKACHDALVASATHANEHLTSEAAYVAKDRTAGFGACGVSGTLSLPDQPTCPCSTATSTSATFDPEQAAATAGSTGRSGFGGRLTSILVAIGAALGLVRRAFTTIPTSTGTRFAGVRRSLLLRLPLAVVSLVGVWLLAEWTYQYAASPPVQSQLFGLFLVGAGVIVQLVNPNTTSMHEFYRERLASAFAVGRFPKRGNANGNGNGNGNGARDRQGQWAGDVAAQLPPVKGPYKLSELAEPFELVLCTTANVNDQLVVPTRRFGVPMTFSPRKVRLEGTGRPVELGYQDTSAIEADARWRSLSVMSAVAMSGAAVSPLMGRMGGKVAPFRLLLTLFNVRLGVWVMNPRWPLEQPPSPALAPMATNPRFHQLFSEAFGSTMVDDRWLYLTDGGHLDNLGMVEAVRRGPGKLLVLSASNDPAGTWQDVGAAVSVIRADLGINLDVTERDYQDSWLRLSGTWRTPEGEPDQAMEVLVVRATLIDEALATKKKKSQTVVKQQQWDLANPMPVDVKAFATKDSTFPRTSTGRQDFGDLEFESYRRIGQYLVERALAANQGFLAPATAQPTAP